MHIYRNCFFCMLEWILFLILLILLLLILFSHFYFSYTLHERYKRTESRTKQHYLIMGKIIDLISILKTHKYNIRLWILLFYFFFLVFYLSFFNAQHSIISNAILITHCRVVIISTEFDEVILIIMNIFLK